MRPHDTPLEGVSGIDGRGTGPVCALEERTRAFGILRICERSRDQPPAIVRRTDAPGLKAGDERRVLGEIFPP
ncbi:MAG: hypothetical protein AAGF13_06595 [Pseudomonadota bacterium]